MTEPKPTYRLTAQEIDPFTGKMRNTYTEVQPVETFLMFCPYCLVDTAHVLVEGENGDAYICRRCFNATKVKK
jgi:hypothetical protein